MDELSETLEELPGIVPLSDVPPDTVDLDEPHHAAELGQAEPGTSEGAKREAFDHFRHFKPSLGYRLAFKAWVAMSGVSESDVCLAALAFLVALPLCVYVSFIEFVGFVAVAAGGGMLAGNLWAWAVGRLADRIDGEIMRFDRNWRKGRA